MLWRCGYSTAVASCATRTSFLGSAVERWSTLDSFVLLQSPVSSNYSDEVCRSSSSASLVVVTCQWLDNILLQLI